MVVRPFYVLALYSISYVFGDMQTRAEQSLIQRADHQAIVGNAMWCCYFLIPVLVGLVNAYVLKIDWSPLPATSTTKDNLLSCIKFFAIPFAFAAGVAAFLTWGVAESFDTVVFGAPCVAPEGTPECVLDEGCQLGLGECAPLRSAMDQFWYLLQSSQDIWPLLIWLLSLLDRDATRSLFTYYVIAGFSQVRFILTECTGIPFAMRTVNLNYEEKSWLIGIPTTTVNTDLLAMLLFLSLCSSKKVTKTAHGFMTIPIGVYKTRLTFSIPVYIFFSAAGALTSMAIPIYCFSLSQSFMYVFGVAVPAYNLWDYGWLRTMSCLLAREYEAVGKSRSCECLLNGKAVDSNRADEP
jgi:hypothetical protein